MIHGDAVGLRDGEEGIARLDNIGGCPAAVAIRAAVRGQGGHVGRGAAATATVVRIYDRYICCRAAGSRTTILVTARGAVIRGAAC